MSNTGFEVVEEQCSGEGCTTMLRHTPGERSLCRSCFIDKYSATDEATNKAASLEARELFKRTRRDPDAKTRTRRAQD